MNIDKIFSLFDKDNPQPEQFEGTPHLDYTQVRFCYGMFEKMINQISSFSEYVKSKKISNKNIESIGISYLYEKAFLYLSLIELNNSIHYAAIMDSVNKDGLIAIKKCIKFFEDVEEYEKCAFLKNFENFFYLNLAPKK